MRNAGYPPSPYNFPWIVDNRSKRGVAIDLRTDDGQRVLHRLVERADVFVTNAPLDGRAPARRALGGPRAAQPAADLRLDHRLRRDRARRRRGPGFDSTALWARTGLMDLVRPSPDAPPSRSLPGMGDHPTGMALFGAIMAALYQRERTGRGTMVSTSLMANGLWLTRSRSRASSAGPAPWCGRRARRRSTRSAISTGCRDGRWFLIALTPDGRRWQDFAAAIGRPELLADPRFATPPDRRANARALIAHPGRACSPSATGRSGARSWSRPASRSAWWGRSTTSRTTRRCAPAARWCRSTIRVRAPGLP